MTKYKVETIKTIATDFKTKEDAEEWAANNIVEDDDYRYRIVPDNQEEK